MSFSVGIALRLLKEAHSLSQPPGQGWGFLSAATNELVHFL